MNRNAIDENEHVAAGSSDLRDTNPWLASYGSGTVRSDRRVEIPVQPAEPAQSSGPRGP